MGMGPEQAQVGTFGGMGMDPYGDGLGRVGGGGGAGAGVGGNSADVYDF